MKRALLLALLLAAPALSQPVTPRPCRMDGADCFALAYSNITGIAASKLLGRGSAGGTGAAQEITLGSGLTMTGTTLSASGGALSGGTADRLMIWSAADTATSHPGLLADDTTGALTIGAQSDIVPVTLRAYSSGTSSIQQWQTSGNALLANITHTGGYQLWGLATDASNYERLSLSATTGSSVNITAETAGSGADNIGITLTPAGTSPVLVAGDFAFGQAADAYMYARAQVGYAGRHILRQNNPDGNTQLNCYSTSAFISFAFAGAEKARFAATTFALQLSAPLSWGATSSGTQDVTLERAEAGLVKVTSGIQYVTGTRPTCDATHRGSTWYVAGGAGVADTFEICRKDSGDAYAWVTLF